MNQEVNKEGIETPVVKSDEGSAELDLAKLDEVNGGNSPVPTAPWIVPRGPAN